MPLHKKNTTSFVFLCYICPCIQNCFLMFRFIWLDHQTDMYLNTNQSNYLRHNWTILWSFVRSTRIFYSYLELLYFQACLLNYIPRAYFKTVFSGLDKRTIIVGTLATWKRLTSAPYGSWSAFKHRHGCLMFEHSNVWT